MAVVSTGCFSLPLEKQVGKLALSTRSKKGKAPLLQVDQPHHPGVPLSESFQFLPAFISLGNRSFQLLQFGLIAQRIVLRITVIIGALHGGGEAVALRFHLLDLLGQFLEGLSFLVQKFSFRELFCRDWTRFWGAYLGALG